jgi:hypothetical protein
MLSGSLSYLSPGNLAYLGLVIGGFMALAITLAVVSAWSDAGLPKSGRAATRSDPDAPPIKKAA